MIPAFNASGVLPPFIGGNPTVQASASPYEVTATELVVRFATTPERTGILNGLLTYRTQLVAAGIDNGFQWLDGSFVEDIEAIEGRPPADVDVVTFAHRPTAVANQNAWVAFFGSNLRLFDPRTLKATLKCDAYYVDLDLRPDLTVSTAGYWYGLFAHRRTGVWKGILRLPLISDDILAKGQLTGAAP
jgi:hypothetical protein